MKGKIHEFLRSLWHFLNLEINAGIHIEGRERERRKEKELETETATKREKMNKYVLSAYYVPGTSPGGQTDDHMVENRLAIIFSQKSNIIEVIYVDTKYMSVKALGQISYAKSRWKSGEPIMLSLNTLED